MNTQSSYLTLLNLVCCLCSIRSRLTDCKKKLLEKIINAKEQLLQYFYAVQIICPECKPLNMASIVKRLKNFSVMCNVLRFMTNTYVILMIFINY